MRFMVIVKAKKDSEAGVMPSEELLIAMGKFNSEFIPVRREGLTTEPRRHEDTKEGHKERIEV